MSKATAPIGEKLAVPSQLQPNSTGMFPVYNYEDLLELQAAGWSKVGVMATIRTLKSGRIAMLSHNKRGKNDSNALGPLGETGGFSGPVIEQPRQTFYRGLSEELGVKQPATLHLLMPETNGWVINQWPNGADNPDQYSFAVSFVTFMADSVFEKLIARSVRNEEANALRAMSYEQIMNVDETKLRPGVKNYFREIASAGLLTAEAGPLVEVDFSGIYEASLQDIDLRTFPNQVTASTIG